VRKGERGRRRELGRKEGTWLVHLLYYKGPGRVPDASASAAYLFAPLILFS
jgi:hypothetical protein